MKPYKGPIFCARLVSDGSIHGHTFHIVTGERGSIRTSPVVGIPDFTISRNLPSMVETQNSRYHVMWDPNWLIEAGQGEWQYHLRTIQKENKSGTS